LKNGIQLKDKFKLSSAVKIIDGVNSWCLMNLLRGDFVLINRSAAEMLLAFSDGASIKDVFNLINVPDKHYKAVNKFLEQCVQSEILVNISKIKDPHSSPSLDSSHISANTLSIVLELTNKCNLSCQHCYNHSGIDQNDELSLAEIEKIFSEIISGNYNLKTLILTGGEPFLYQNLVNVLNMAIDYGFHSIRINTNGTIWKNLSLEKISSNLLNKISIQITLLGLKEQTHDAMTQSIGSFERTIKNIHKFQRIGLNIGISFIRSKYSESEIEEAQKMGENLGVEVILGDLFPLGRANENYSSLELNSNHQEKLVVCDNNYYGGIGAGILSKDKWLSLLDSFPPELACGKNTIAICSNGNVIPCMLLQGIVIGNIRNQSLTNIMKSPILDDFRKKISIENRNTCSKCELRYVCSNKCPAVSLSFGGDITMKNPFCTYY